MKSIFLLIGAMIVQFGIAGTTLSQDNPVEARPDERRGPPNFFAMGAAAASGQVEFTGGSFQLNAFPFINFRQGRFHSSQAGVGFEAIKKNGYRLSFVTEVGINEQNRNDVNRLNDMKDLNLPIYGGISLDVTASDFVLTGTIQRELGFASEGWRAAAKISRPYNINRDLSLTPSVALHWFDDRLTNYLYGVPAINSRVDRAFYRADDSIQGRASLTTVYRLSERITLIGAGTLTLYGDSIHDSSIVARRTALSMFLAIGYSF